MMTDKRTKLRFAALALLLFFSVATLPARAEFAAEAQEFFETRIRPVLAQDCYECHRSNGKKKGGLALDSRAALLEGGDSGKVIVPGDPVASLLIRAIRHESQDLEMPKARAKLEESVIADFEKWIRMGAPDPRDAPPTDAQMAADTDWAAVMRRREGWWSFQPVRKFDLSKLPPVGRSNHLIDRFIDTKLADAHLSPAPMAESRILIRRLSYALRGLPPSTAEIESFVQDTREDAYERLVDSFLASPRFGECWARHWMDWVRYADSHGSEGDATIPYAWRYRDYLIRALNADVPYNQMVREHLAGDLLAKPRINQELGLNESALGIGHLRMVFHGFAPTDPLDEQVRFTDDQIGVISKAFLGLTVSCARCHDHKFDPISQKDFYGWYGMLVSCPPASIQVDAPRPEVQKRRLDLAKQKEDIKAALARVWLRDADKVAQKLTQPSGEVRKLIQAAKKSDSILHPFFVLNQKDGKENSLKGVFVELHHMSNKVWSAASHFKQWNFTRTSDFNEWRRDGDGGAEVSKAGVFSISPEGDTVLVGIYPSGVYSHLLSSKDRGVLLSPRVALDDKYDLWLRVAGNGGAVVRYVVQNYPRDGSIYPYNRLEGGQWRWMKFNLDYWQGDRIHVEVTTAADQPVLADVDATRSWFGIRDVVLTKTGEPGPADAGEFIEPLVAAFDGREPSTEAELAEGYTTAVRASVQAWVDGNITDGQALFLDAMLRSGLLQNRLNELSEVKSLVQAYREQEDQIPVPTRAPGVLETKPFDQPLFIRGNHKQPSDPVPRRFLEAIDATPYSKTESGRRQFAEDLVRPDNPLFTRVIVNRVWHYLFGRGIVATPDNFGRLGREPSHPELLDFLAGWFAEHGYSIKALIRYIVTSETWRSSSAPRPGAVEKDPENVLLSHFNVRRLEAEAIRDTLLAVAGDLKEDAMYGPPVTGHSPRRSVYLRVKRNDLDPFLSTFDAPAPASTTGQRDVTNVPGQSLALLNDPFVIELAEHWAAREENNPALKDVAARIRAMFAEALGRAPTETELKRVEEFLKWTGQQRAAVESDRSALEETIKKDKERMAAVSAEARSRILSNRGRSADRSEKNGLNPVAVWNFGAGLEDQAGTLHGKLFGNAHIEQGALVLDGKSSYIATAPLAKTLKAKTLEAWVQLNQLDQQGGGVMTVQDLTGTVFDSIVFGEQQPGRWMAGSDFFNRTKSFEGTAETEAEKGPVHIAIVYAEDGTITGYRNGQLYGKAYQSSGPITFEAGKSQVLFGNRHGESGGNRNLTGRIYRALLYDRALTAQEVEASASRDSDFITQREVIGAMTEKEQREHDELQADLTRCEERLGVLKKTAGLSSQWASLGHALFNVKEFIYVQ